MSNALAVEARFTVAAFLQDWADRGLLSYKFSVHESAREPTRVRVTLSKPTAQEPAPAAVAHLFFRLDASLREVLGFTVEGETHFRALADLRFDEAVVDQAIRRKLRLREQQLVSLRDEFSSTRVPALRRERELETRDRDREALEELLLERFQRKDPYNDGRLSFHEAREAVLALELPGVGRRDREVLFAFVELDRDELVDYGAIVSICAEVLDTLLHAPSPDGGDAVEDFQAVVRHHQFATMDRLACVLDSLRPPPPTPPPPPAEEVLSSPQEDAETSAEEAKEENEPLGTTPAPVEELIVTRRQLRTALETPHLLLSRAEINLVCALATASPSGQIACGQLNELLQHVQSLVFRFQSRCMGDRLERYLLQQFTEYESSKLPGSAEHLKMRVHQREVKAVVKDMKKLLLSPFQAAKVASLCEDSLTDPDQIVHYKDCVPRVAKWLALQVDPHDLRERAAAVHALHLHERGDRQLPDEDTVKQLAVEAFESLDAKRLGVVSIADFHSGLTTLSRAMETTVLDELDDMALVTALADPMGHGRVNYVYFQQLLHPVLRWLQYEKRVRQLREDPELCRVSVAEAKRADIEDDEDSKLGEK